MAARCYTEEEEKKRILLVKSAIKDVCDALKHNLSNTAAEEALSSVTSFDGKFPGLACESEFHGEKEYFAGQMVLKQDERVVWKASFRAHLMGDGPECGARIAQFILNALNSVKDALSINGPKKFRIMEYEFYDEHNGPFADFSGEWLVWKDHSTVLRMKYFGGIVA